MCCHSSSDHWVAESTTASSKHTLVTQNPGGPTQGTPGHVPNHFFDPSATPPPRPDFFIFLEESVFGPVLLRP
jgi:hypothetical protein